jgi:hypothetical protein
LRAGRLVWRAVPGAVSYAVHRNAVRHAVTTATQARVDREDGLSEYQVMAMDARGLESFLSEPIRVVLPNDVIVAQPAGAATDTTLAGAARDEYIELTVEANTEVQFTVDVPVAGTYAIDARYANGSGPINSGDKAAVRSLLVDGTRVGSLVMPHRGVDLWTDWGYSSAVVVPLSAGTHTITVAYTPVDRNMNGVVNTARVDHLRLTRLEE